MKPKIIDSPTERYTSRSSSPRTRKNRARRPSSAKALAVKTMNGSSVTPNTAGMESRANRRSIDPMATSTSSSGVATRRPSTRVTSLPST